MNSPPVLKRQVRPQDLTPGVGIPCLLFKSLDKQLDKLDKFRVSQNIP